MSITAELREYADMLVGIWSEDCKKLLAIANRIDAEHEEKVSYWQEASYKDGYDEGFASADDWLAQHEDAMAEHGWYRALCADGKPMLLGDAMEWCNGTFTIHELRFTEGGCTTWDSEHGYTVNADECRHYHKPTVEDVLDEIVDKANSIGCAYAKNDISGEEMMGALQAIVAEYAAKLRLAGDAE